MVVIFVPVTEEAMVRQDRLALPSISTVQAPHCPSPQPYFVPVMSSRLRNTESKVSSAGARTGSSEPLMLRRKSIQIPPAQAERCEHKSEYADLMEHLIADRRDRTVSQSVGDSSRRIRSARSCTPDQISTWALQILH